MGRWGDAPFENDAALDVRDAYVKLRSAGMRPADAEYIQEYIQEAIDRA